MSTLTEEEAKEKWCPFARVREANQGSAAAVNIRSLGTPSLVRCIASECMAWRGKTQWRPRSDYPWEDGKAESSGPNVQERIVGHCGLAGRPA